jgi:hypothetical protein
MRTDRLMPLFDDAGPFASAYVDLSQDHENADATVELNVRAACDTLTREGAPEDVVTAVGDALAHVPDGPSPVSRFVVATPSGRVLLDEVTRTRRPQPSASWSALPDVSAWLADADRRVPHVLAVVDHEGGGVSVHPEGLDGPVESSEEGGETDFEHKVRGGGWAHLTWQHYNESVWARNARRVADRVRQHVDDGIGLVLLAGDPRSRSEVVQYLGDTGATVVQLDAGGRNADGGDEALRQAVERALEEALDTARVEEVDRLQERLGRDDSVAIGVADTVDALVRGQVDRLLLDPSAAGELTVEPEHHPGLALGAVVPPATTPADRALVAAATLTGAAVEVVPASMLSGAPVAALLRWDQAAEGVRA